MVCQGIQSFSKEEGTNGCSKQNTEIKESIVTVPCLGMSELPKSKYNFDLCCATASGKVARGSPCQTHQNHKDRGKK
jgi:hypothetical protein